MRFALLFSLGMEYHLILAMLLASVSLVHCGKFKDAIKAYKNDDIHSQCIPVDKLQEARAERDACRTRLGQIFTKNAELEIHVEELQQVLEAREAEIVSIRNEMSIRLARLENRLQRYTSHDQPQHAIQRPNPPVPMHHYPQPSIDPIQQSQAQHMHTTQQSPAQAAPRMISSESPAFQRMVRAHKSQNDLKWRQQRQHGGGGGQF